MALWARVAAVLAFACITGCARADDSIPPSWVAGYPLVASRTGTSVTLAAQLNEQGLLYAVVLPFHSTPPTAFEVKARTGSGGSAAVASATKDVVLAFSQTEVVLTNLQPSTTYDAFLIAEDLQSPTNVQDAVVKLTFVTTDEVDASPPLWQPAFPATSSTHDSVSVDVQLDEPCTVFFAVMWAGTPPASAAELVAGTVTPAFLAAPPGNFDVPAPATTTAHTFSGLAVSTSYQIVLAARDLQAPPNLQPVVTTLAVSTTAAPDVTAPSFPPGSPTAGDATDSSFNLVLQLSEPGTVHVLVALAPSTYPTAAQVQAGHADGLDVVDARAVVVSFPAFPFTSSFTSLTADTVYDIYCVGEDVAGNTMIVPAHTSVSTLPDATSPTFSSGFPRLASVTDSAVKLDVQLSEAGVLSYVIARGHGLVPLPTPAQVAAGGAGEGRDVVSAGAQAVPVAMSTESVVASGLQASAQHTLWCVAEDSHEPANRQAAVVAVEFTTDEDVTAPTFALGYPRTSHMTDIEAFFAVMLSEPGQVAVVLLPPASPAPSTSDVLSVRDPATTSLPGAPAAWATVGDAWVEVALTVPQLPSATDMVAYVAAEDASPNAIAQPLQLMLTTLPDATAPHFVTPITLSDVTDSSAVVHMTPSEAGKCWLVVTTQHASPPTAAQVLQGLQADGTSAMFHAIVDTLASTASQVALDGLPHLQPISVYFVAQDSHTPVPNTMTTPVEAQFTTLADATFPTFPNGYPVITASGDTQIGVQVALSEAGTVLVVATPLGADTLTPVDLAELWNSGNVEAHAILALAQGVVSGAGTPTDVVLTGLPHSTAVHIYVICRDASAAANMQPQVVTLTTATAADATPPVFTSLLRVVAVSDSAVAVEAAVDEGAVLHVVAQPTETVTTMSAAQIVAFDAESDTLSAYSSATLTQQVPTNATVTGLAHGTSYRVCVVAVDTSPAANPQATPFCLDATTLPDATPPQFTTAPHAEGGTDTTIIVAAGTDEAATVHVLVYAPEGAAAASAVTSAEVAMGMRDAATASGTFQTAAPTVEGRVLVGNLTHSTTYIVVVAAVDSHGNLQATTTVVSLTTKVDQTPPYWVSQPAIQDVTDSSATLRLATNEAGRVFCVVAAQGNAPSLPTASEVRAGSWPSAGTVLDAVEADLQAGDGNYEALVTTTQLPHTLAATAVCVAQDEAPDGGQANLQQDAEMIVVHFVTLADATPPSFVVGSPHSTSISDTGFTVAATLTEPAVLFALPCLATIDEAAILAVTTDMVRGQSPLPPQLSGVCLGRAASTGNDPSFSTAVSFQETQHATSYIVFVVAQDVSSAANVQAVPVTVAVTTGADATPPQVTTFEVVEATDSSVTVLAALSEPGTVHALVMRQEDTAPTAQDVVAATAVSPAELAVSHTDVVSSDTPARITLSPIPHAAQLVVYATATDTAAPPNTTPTTTQLAFETSSDATAPVFASGSPMIMAATDSSVTLAATLNEPGRFFFVVVPSGVVMPSVEQVVNGDAAEQVGFGARTVFAAGVAQVVQVSSLRHSTQYDVYLVAQDSATNTQVEVTLVTASTASDATAPAFQLATPAVVATTDSGANVSLALSEPGTIVYVLLPGGNDGPARDDVWAAGEAAERGDVSALASLGCLQGGVVEVREGGTSTVLQLHGLVHDTAYTFVAVAQDMASPPNMQDDTTAMGVHTASDSTAPTTFGVPVVHDVTDAAATLSGFALSENGTVYMLALPATHPVPAFAQIVAGLLSDGQRAAWQAAVSVQAGRPQTVTVSGLHHDTAYDIVLQAVDDAQPVANVQAVATIVPVRTQLDGTPPSVVEGFPRVDSVTETGFQLTMALNEAGLVTAVVTAVDTGVVAAVVAIDVVEARVPRSVAVVDLVPDTNYAINMTVRDKHPPTGNVAPQGELVYARTALDVHPPVFSIGYPRVDAVNESWVAIAVRLQEAGDVWAAAFPEPPTAAAAAAIQWLADPVPGLVQAGAVSVATISTPSWEVTLHGLVGSTRYQVWVLARDRAFAPNAQAAPTLLTVLTTEDKTPPTLLHESPVVTSVTDTSFALQVSTDEEAEVSVTVTLQGTYLLSPPVMFAGTLHCNRRGANVTIEGLPSSALFLVAVRATDTRSPANAGNVHTLTVATLADSHAPKFDATPYVTSTDEAAVLSRVLTNEPAQVMWVMVRGSAPLPPALSADVVRVATALDQAGVAAMDGVVARGVLSIDAARIERGEDAVTVISDALVPGGVQYTVLLVAQDLSSPPNTSPSPLLLPVITRAGSGLPIFLRGFPAVSTASDTWAMFEVKLNVPGRVYFETVASPVDGVRNASDIVRSAARCDSLSDSCGVIDVPEGSAAHFGVAHALEPDTAFYMYLVAAPAGVFGAELAAEAVSGAAHWTLAFATSEAMPPAAQHGFPRVVASLFTAAILRVSYDEPALTHVVAMETEEEQSGAAPVDAAWFLQHVAGKPLADVSAAFADIAPVAWVGTVDSASPLSQVDLNVTGLEPGTTYVAWLLATDRHSRHIHQAEVQALTWSSPVPPGLAPTVLWSNDVALEALVDVTAHEASEVGNGGTLFVSVAAPSQPVPPTTCMEGPGGGAVAVQGAASGVGAGTTVTLRTVDIGTGLVLAFVESPVALHLLVSAGDWQIGAWTCRAGVVSLRATAAVPVTIGDETGGSGDESGSTDAGQSGQEAVDITPPSSTSSPRMQDFLPDTPLGIGAVCIALLVVVCCCPALARRRCGRGAKRVEKSADRYMVRAMSPSSSADSVTRQVGRNDEWSDDEYQRTPLRSASRAQRSSTPLSASSSRQLGFGSPVPWAKRIVRRLTSSTERRQRRRPRGSVEELTPLQPQSGSVPPPPTSDSDDSDADRVPLDDELSGGALPQHKHSAGQGRVPGALPSPAVSVESNISEQTIELSATSPASTSSALSTSSPSSARGVRRVAALDHASLRVQAQLRAARAVATADVQPRGGATGQEDTAGDEKKAEVGDQSAATESVRAASGGLAAADVAVVAGDGVSRSAAENSSKPRVSAAEADEAARLYAERAAAEREVAASQKSDSCSRGATEVVLPDAAVTPRVRDDQESGVDVVSPSAWSALSQATPGRQTPWRRMINFVRGSAGTVSASRSSARPANLGQPLRDHSAELQELVRQLIPSPFTPRRTSREGDGTGTGTSLSHAAILATPLDARAAASPESAASSPTAGFATPSRASTIVQRQDAPSQSVPRRPTSVQSAARRPASVRSAARRPASVRSAARRPASVRSAARRPTSVLSTARRPTSVRSAARRPTTVRSAAARPGTVQSARRPTLKRGRGALSVAALAQRTKFRSHVKRVTHQSMVQHALRQGARRPSITAPADGAGAVAAAPATQEPSGCAEKGRRGDGSGIPAMPTL